ncbi:dTMP kinase [candidate division Kazan bacterium RIFCSPHIGHO2_01_FULL_49_10]|uniref:Thymidylate kinase n=1 Tax=candidate division Kazan bacterium RIFCSPLOWO2_01_FULL_48_13 TaxID=1798539 RepID=A0A1F4PQN7_UNCK3|nr:MAG: dTMP kinase [candidate division Kazan bacterium RIFCSPHIGHO2_01_FULL_49_10]OGB85362.1 MAG: dTMP kinase [candidate division Kazan bacterium RIFCSPLOWO2_01_FULL_48_13]
MKNNRFIVFEGIDGSGHTTQAKLLADYLAEHNASVWLTNEPTLFTEAGRNIKATLRGELPMPSDPLEFQKLYVEDRRIHVEEIKQHLAGSEWVICDRYVPSTVAYGSGSGADYQTLLELNQQFPVPDTTFFLDVNPTVAVERVKGRGEAREFFEYEEKLSSIRQNYLRLMENYPHMKLINGEQGIADIAAQARAILGI